MNQKERIEEVIFKYHNHVYSDEVEQLLKVVTESKKEVFDLYLAELKRIKPIFTDEPTKTVITQLIYFTYNNKRRHLSTFPKEEKEHNNDFKKPCPKCKGDGEITVFAGHINEIEECPVCKGQGFIKS